MILKLKDYDELLFSQFITTGKHLIVASSSERLLHFPVNDEQLPAMGVLLCACLWARSLGVGFLAPAGVLHTLGAIGLPCSCWDVATGVQ
jgi:hypothetical protein